MSDDLIIRENEIANFQYFVLCEAVSHTADSPMVSLRNIIYEVVVVDGQSCELCMQMGAFTAPYMEGKALSIVLGRCSSKASRQAPREVHRVVLSGRKVPGPWYYGHQLVYTPGSMGMAMLQVVDVDGAFGPSGAILSTFKFLVRLIPPK